MCSFNDCIVADAFHAPAIRIYPVADFRAVNSNVGESLNGLLAAIDNHPVDENNIFVVDLFNAGQFIRSQVSYIHFQNGQGLRYLSQYGQAAYPIGWPNLFYTFQGFTDDGAFYISVILPVNHPSLPDPDDVTLDNDFYDNFMTYTADMSVQLNGEDPGSFVPSLYLLADMIKSSLVEPQ